MLGLLVVISALSGPSLKPTIYCYTIHHGLDPIFAEEGTKHAISGHGMRGPTWTDSRHVDDKFRRMRLPILPKHLPTARNHTFGFIFHLERPVGIGTDQMRATHETRRHPPVRETVQLRVAAPDKDTIAGTGSFDDLPNNWKKIEPS